MRLPFDGDYPLTQEFGANPDDYARFGLAGHNGLDYGVPLLTPLLAPCDGEVWEAEYDVNGYGYYVKLRTAAGEDVLLAHGYHRCTLEPGTWVAEGTFLFCSGTSGNSTGPHVHFGYRPSAAERSGPMQGWSRPPV